MSVLSVDANGVDSTDSLRLFFKLSVVTDSSSFMAFEEGASGPAEVSFEFKDVVSVRVREVSTEGRASRFTVNVLVSSVELPKAESLRPGERDLRGPR